MPLLSNISELASLVSDAAHAVASADAGPADIFDHAEILRRIEEGRSALPPLYDQAIGASLGETFRRIGVQGWQDVLQRDPAGNGIGLLGRDLVQCITQRADDYQADATDAFQEVVSDLYDGFLSASDRSGVKPPDHGIAAPLVKWGRPADGPYAWPAPAAALYGCEAGIVNMPPAFATRGLAAWGAIGHETAGHHVLHADDGLHEALSDAVYTKVLGSTDQDLIGSKKKDTLREFLAQYWADRVDESASDVMGIVNMGPAAAVALIAYFRGLAAVWRGEARLSPIGSASAVHPAPLARGVLMAEAIGYCKFEGHKAWRDHVLNEVINDVPADGMLHLAGEEVSFKAMQASALNAASAILTAKMEPLEQRSLRDIQDWYQHDQEIVEALTLSVILGGQMPSGTLQGGLYAAHGVAAGIMGALLTGRPDEAQARLIQVVAAMHRRNPSWSLLSATHYGDFLGAIRQCAGGGGTDGAVVPVLAGGTDGSTVPIPLGGTDGPQVPVLFGHPNWPKAGREVIRSVLGCRSMTRWHREQIGIAVDGEDEERKFVPVNNGTLGDSITSDTLKLVLGSPD